MQLVRRAARDGCLHVLLQVVEPRATQQVCHHGKLDAAIIGRILRDTTKVKTKLQRARWPWHVTCKNDRGLQPTSMPPWQAWMNFTGSCALLPGSSRTPINMASGIKSYILNTCKAQYAEDTKTAKSTGADSTKHTTAECEHALKGLALSHFGEIALSG